MKKKWRRRRGILRSLASFMLVIILITGVVPIAVFAAEYDGEETGDPPPTVSEEAPKESGDSGSENENKTSDDEEKEPGVSDDANAAGREDGDEPEEELQPLEPQLVSGTISTSADGGAVSISGLLPEGASVSAKRAGVKIDGYEVIIAYDIRIMAGGGQWQPVEPVKVTISSPMLEGVGNAGVFHVTGGSSKLVSNVSVSGAAVSFTVSGFSVYAVAVRSDEKTEEPASGSDEPDVPDEPDIFAEEPEDEFDEAADEIISAEDEEPAVYVMNYYIAGELTNTRPVNEEGYADNLPVFKTAYPPNATRFMGWYTQPDGGVPFNFSAPLTEDTNVYAHFDKSVLIKYKSQAGGSGDEHVIDTKILNAGTGYGVPSTSVEPQMPAGMANAHITHWYIEGGSPEDIFIWGTPAEGDLTLVPFWSNTWWVFFESEGSAVEPALVADGGTAAEPAPPTRTGYDFLHWSTEPEGPQYSFDTPVVGGNLFLYAVWEPQVVDYTITYWVERPDFTGDPGTNPDNYIFYKSVEQTAPAGSIASHTTSGGLDTITVASGSYDIKWAEFSHGEEKTVLGTGTTVINVYFKRIEFTYIFNLNPGTSSNTSRNGASMVFGGTTYAQGVNASASGTAANSAAVNYPDNQYSFKAKFEQNIENLWPSSANATLVKETRSRSNTTSVWGAVTTSGFCNWDASKVSNITASSAYVTKRFTITHDMLPTSGTSVTFPATWGTTRNVTVNYHIESLLSENGGVQKSFAGVTPDRYYLKSALHSQVLVLQNTSSLSAKNIEGITHVGNGGTYSSSTSVYDFYYTRNRYTISFNTVGGGSIPSITDVMFGEPLIYGGYDSTFNIIPEKTVDGVEYVFEGWYLDAEYNKPFNRAAMTMPNSNLMLYANWQANDYIVEYYDSLSAGAHLIGEPQPIGRGEPVNLEHAPYKPGDVVEGKGTFDAWYVKMGSNWSRWPAERTASGNIELYAGWRTDGFRLTYNLGSGTGVLPSDSDVYWLEKQARLSYGEGIVPPEGYAFVGWKASYQGISGADADTVWSPGDYYPLYGDTVMTAVYAELGSCVEIVYFSNYAGDAEGTEETVRQWVVPDAQGNVKLKGEIFERDDAILQRWDTQRDAAGASHGLGTTMAAPGETLYLYGIWLDNVYTITFNASNNGTLELDGTQNKQFAYHEIRGGSNWGSAVGAAGGVPVPAANDGYAFKEWRSGSITGAAADMTAEAARTVNGNLQYWAIFEPLYTVTYHGNGSTYGTAPEDGNNPYFSGDSVTVLGQGDLWKSNWTFAGWNTKADGSGTSFSEGGTFTMPAGNVHLYAQWQVAIDVEIIANSTMAIYDGTEHTASGYTFKVRAATTDGTKGAVLGDDFTVEAFTSDPVSADITSPSLPNDIDRSRVVVKYKGVDVTTISSVALRSISYIDGELTVKPRPLVITAGSDSKVYDGTPLTFADRELAGGMYGISGLTPLAEGHEISSLTFSGSQTNPGSSENTASGAVITAADGSNVTANYEIEYIPGVLVVTTSAEEVIITAASAEKVYDGTALSNDALDDAGTILPAGVTRVEAVVEGTQTGVNMTGANNIITSYRLYNGNTDVTDNYTAVTLIPGNLIVTPRPVVITAASASKIYDGTALTNGNSSWSKIEGNDDSGLVSGHNYTVTVEGSQLTAGSSGNIAGAAVITDAGGNDVTGNYDISYVSGTLTVYAGGISVYIPYTKVYGDPDPSLDGVRAALQAEVDAQLTAQGLQAGDINVTVSGRGPGEDVAGSPYKYEVAWTIANNSEFITGEISIAADLTITPKTIIIEAHPKMKMYGNDDPAFTVRPITGLAGNDIIEYELYRENKSEDAGVYFINAEIDYDKYPNYKIEYIGNWLTITPRPVVLVAQDVTIRVGDPLPEHPNFPHYVSSYFPLAKWDAGLAYELYTTAEDSSVAGEFPIRFRLDRNDPLNRNYIIYVVPATLYIIDDTAATPAPTPTPTPPPPPPPPGGTVEDPSPPPEGDADADADGDTDGGTDGDTVVPEEPDPVPEGAPPPTITIPGMPLPLAEQPVIETLTHDMPLAFLRNDEQPAWALWNLILSISGVVLAIAMGIRAFVKKEEDEDGTVSAQPRINEDEEEETRYYKKNVILCLAVPVTAVLACILFIVTQDIKLPMTLVDEWTAAHAALFTGGLMSFVFADHKDKDKDKDEAEEAPA